jgi:hypothetical protein
MTLILIEPGVSSTLVVRAIAQETVPTNPVVNRIQVALKIGLATEVNDPAIIGA